MKKNKKTAWIVGGIVAFIVLIVLVRQRHKKKKDKNTPATAGSATTPETTKSSIPASVLAEPIEDWNDGSVMVVEGRKFKVVFNEWTEVS